MNGRQLTPTTAQVDTFSSLMEFDIDYQAKNVIATVHQTIAGCYVLVTSDLPSDMDTADGAMCVISYNGKVNHLIKETA